MSAPDRDRYVEILPWRGGLAHAIHIYREPAGWWVGLYKGPTYNYVCIVPTIVIRWARRGERV